VQDALKQTLVDAGLVLDAHGQGDAARGHISVRNPRQYEINFAYLCRKARRQAGR
jgi:hypothetical protein